MDDIGKMDSDAGRLLKLETYSEEETIGLGIKLGSRLSRGDVIALAGELGSGKTRFTKGVALGLGVPPDTVVTSPSFSLLNEYEGRCPLFHIDAYRLESQADFEAAGLEEFFYQDGVVVMEWAERWPELLPDHRLKVELTLMGDRERQISFSGFHPRSIALIEEIDKD